MARIGSFTGPTTPYGIPPAAAEPIDNNINPDPALAQSDELKAQAEALLEDLKNLNNDKTGKKQ